MYEHRSEPLLSRRKFYHRLLRNAAFTFLLIAIALALGAVGYHLFCGMKCDDAILNASMILTGMGPVGELHGSVAKYFASFYAVVSGVFFPTTIALMLAPIVHRFLHKLHLQEDASNDKD